MCDECKRGILPNKTFWECKKTNYCICDRYPSQFGPQGTDHVVAAEIAKLNLSHPSCRPLPSASLQFSISCTCLICLPMNTTASGGARRPHTILIAASRRTARDFI